MLDATTGGQSKRHTAEEITDKSNYEMSGSSNYFQWNQYITTQIHSLTTQQSSNCYLWILLIINGLGQNSCDELASRHQIATELLCLQTPKVSPLGA